MYFISMREDLFNRMMVFVDIWNRHGPEVAAKAMMTMTWLVGSMGQTSGKMWQVHGSR